MADQHVSFEVAADSADVFALVSDLVKLPSWDSSVRSIEINHDQGPAIGRSYDVVVGFYGKALDAEYEVDSFEAGTSIGYTITGRADGRVDISVEPSERGSLVDYRVQLRMKGLAKLLDKGLGAALEGIVGNCESGLKKQLRSS